METDRMAALGFSVLMREWRRRGWRLIPGIGSLYLKLSAVITLPASFSSVSVVGTRGADLWRWI